MRYAHLGMSAKLLFSATSYISDMVPGSFPVASFRGSRARSFLAGVLHAGTVGRPVRTDRRKPLS